MKKLLKEFLWIIGSYLAIITIKNTLIPLDNPKYYKEVFMNAGGNNYIITNLEVFIALLIIGYFIIYQLRCLVFRYKNQFSNYILIFSQILLIAQLSLFIAFAFSVKNSIAISNNSTFYLYDVKSDLNWQSIFYRLLVCQVVISGFLFYNAIRIKRVKLIKEEWL